MASWAVNAAAEPLVVPAFAEDSAKANDFAGWTDHTEDQIFALPTETTDVVGHHIMSDETDLREIATGSTPNLKIESGSPQMELEQP